MYLEVITPEEVLFKGEVSAVQLPGKDGLFQQGLLEILVLLLGTRLC